MVMGVVTHRRSRFREDALRQLAALADEAGARGWRVETLVSDRDDYDAARLPIDRRTVRASALAQARLEYRWRRYLAAAEGLPVASGAVRAVRDAALWAGTSVVRSARYLSPWPWAPVQRLHGHGSVVRLLNIDLSHLRVLRTAGAAEPDWVLILEDDARTDDPRSAMDALCGALDRAGEQPLYVNASRSIDHSDLGVEGLLGPQQDGIRVARVPVTNTVCAVLYRGTAVMQLADDIEEPGLLPAVPIDWRLNRVLMDRVAEHSMGSDSCWFLDPAPFTQGSMHRPPAVAS